ncbi:MAG: hypothetical protein C5B43_02615 [Verrucomicrobia bacterium]|nr:MAG: hypothetical protein C5B43_02615 [Verrucomicrobiota bacterium]
MNKITPPKHIVEAWKQLNGLVSFTVFALRTVVYIATIGYLNLFPRAKRSIYEFIIKDVDLNRRNVESVNSYSQEVNRVTKLRIIVGLQVMNKVFENTIGGRKREIVDLIQYDENDSIESLANKAIDDYFKIREKKLMPEYIDMSKKYANIAYEIFKETFLDPLEGELDSLKALAIVMKLGRL